MSAEINCSLTIWMKRKRRSTSEVPEMVKLCSHVARSRHEVPSELFICRDGARRTLETVLC